MTVKSRESSTATRLPRCYALARQATRGLPRLRSECLSMTVPAILVIVAFIVVFLALNRFEFGRFD